MRLALVIPDGIGVRNFVFGSFLGQAARRWPVDVLHASTEIAIPRLSSVSSNGVVHWHPLRSEDDRLQEFLRNALGYAHKAWGRSYLMNLSLKQPIQAATWRRRVLTSTARVVGQTAASRRGIKVLDHLHLWAARRAPGVARYRRLLEELRPSVLFCTHQRPPQIIAPVLAARSLGIPTATFIFSWDNLTSKGRIAAPFDHFLVWSELMGEELLRYYPDVAPDQVHVVGTPQFEAHVDPRILWSREEFCRRVGGDPSRPLICYTGADVGTCPGDPRYVSALLDLIRDNAIRGHPQVVLRPTPVDAGTRYDGLRSAYPELLYAPPAWVRPKNGGTWANVMPLPEDAQFLANLAHHSDVNVNWASTVTLDFAIHDKPVVNVAFDVGSPSPCKPGELYERCDHYRPVIALGAARIAHSPADLAAHVNAYLGDPSLDREGRRRLVELEIGWPIGNSSQRIADVLERVSL